MQDVKAAIAELDRSANQLGRVGAMIDDKVNGRTYDVVLGTDWPADMRIDWPAAWVLGLQSLTQEEKEKILWQNLARLLGL
jgi:hypothetical protein